MKPISKTAFYSCGVRMQDAERADSVCGDSLAEVFMDDDGLKIFEDFEDETGPNASTLVRHRIIDDFLRRQVTENRELKIIVIGAGFDSRPYRLPGGDWIELDEPQIIEYKNARLPVAGCANRLRRLPIDFAAESLAEKLSGLTMNNQPSVVVVEGVFMYLDESEIKNMLAALHQRFPQHKLVGDLMNRSFFEEYGKSLHERLTGIGASFKFTAGEPENLFLENGYRRAEKISIIGRAVDLGLLNIPPAALETSLSNLANGNSVFIFESSEI